MSNAYSELIKKYSPTRIEAKVGEKSARFILSDSSRKSLPLKDEYAFKVLKDSIEDMDSFVERKDIEGTMVFFFDWKRNINSRLKQEGKIEPVIITNRKKKNVTMVLDEAREEIRAIMEKNKLLQCVVTSSGVLIEDGEVSSEPIDERIAITVYDAMSQDEEKSMGTHSEDVEVGGVRYRLTKQKVGDEKTIKVTRKIESFSSLVMGMSGEMKARLLNLGSGVIVTTMHPYAKMEPIVSMMRKFDINFDKIACEIGNCLIETKLPKQTSSTHLDKLSETHYKYVLLDMSRGGVDLERVMDIVYSGKLVILGYANDSAYSAMMSLLNSYGGDTFQSTKVLMSTIGFLHPVLSYSDGEFSLEDSESVTLSKTKVQEIVHGDLSRERFNSLIEYPSKVYRVNGNSIFGINEYKGKPIKTQEEEIHALLEYAKKQGASDIHLVVNAYPMFRIRGTLSPIGTGVKLTVEMLKQIVSTLTVTDIQNEMLQNYKELEMAYSVSGLGRFRVQIVTQRGTYGVIIRSTSASIPTLDQIRLPQAVRDAILNNPKGLVLVTGATGSGKSTTCASLIEELKNQDSYAITTISDPIEYLHSHGNGIITQREIPTDVNSYEEALSSSLRMDPDIIEVSEVRTSKAVNALLRFANSGHLAISTMHTSSVKGTFDAIVNMMESERKKEILSTLSQTVVCIINQQLVKGIDGNLIPIFEYLIPNKQIRNYIADNNFNQIEADMKTSATGYGEVASWADFELIRAYEKRLISEDVMYEYLNNKEAMKELRPKL